MSEFHDDYPQYELMAHHSEEEGKTIRRKLWNVFWIMLAVTILELIIGTYSSKMGLLEPDRTSSVLLKFIFIGLTLFKAFFIVFSFMHLGHERKAMKYSVLAPYMIFVLFLIYVIITEAVYCGIHKNKMDNLIVKQKIELNAAAAAESQGAIENKEGTSKQATEEHH